MSKCLDDELYDIYIEDGKQVIESLREIYEKGRADAIDECLHLIEDTPWRDIWMLIDTIKELKEQNK